MRHGKYNAQAIVVDGRRFDSRKEFRRFGELRLMERAGEIMDLVFHPRYLLDYNGHHITTYEADFSYKITKDLVNVVEDCKGYRTDVYKIKKKLMLALLGIEVRET